MTARAMLIHIREKHGDADTSWLALYICPDTTIADLKAMIAASWPYGRGLHRGFALPCIRLASHGRELKEADDLGELTAKDLAIDEDNDIIDLDSFP